MLCWKFFQTQSLNARIHESGCILVKDPAVQADPGRTGPMMVCSGAEVGTWSSEAGYLQELAITSDDAEPWTEECKLHDISEAKEVLQRSLSNKGVVLTMR